MPPACPALVFNSRRRKNFATLPCNILTPLCRRVGWQAHDTTPLDKARAFSAPGSDACTSPTPPLCAYRKTAGPRRSRRNTAQRYSRSCGISAMLRTIGRLPPAKRQTAATGHTMPMVAVAVNISTVRTYASAFRHSYLFSVSLRVHQPHRRRDNHDGQHAADDPPCDLSPLTHHRRRNNATITPIPTTI